MSDNPSDDAKKIEISENKKERNIITYNFAHPARVSKDQQRTLENLHSNMARMMASSFSSRQRSVVDCDIKFVDQTTYGEFITSLSNPSSSYSFTIEPLGGPAIIDFSLPVAYSFIDRQFGGTGGNPPSEKRPLTSIEQNVMSKVMNSVLVDLEATWEPLLKIRTLNSNLDTNPEHLQIAASSNTIILIAFEVNSQHASGLVNLCYPYFTLEPILSYLNVQSWASRLKGKKESSKEERQQRLQQLQEIDLPVTAQLAETEIPLNEIADLQVGDVIKLDTRIDEPTVVFVGEHPKFLARPTRTGEQIELQLTQRISKDQEIKYLNSVQKNEAYLP